MFQFTTTTLINDNLDYTTKLPRWSVQQEEDDKVASFNIKRVGNFKNLMLLQFIKENILLLY